MKRDGQEAFVPLTAAELPDGRRPDLRVTVLKPSDGPQAFEPLVTAGAANSAGAAAGKVNFSARPASAVCEPRVSVEREGNTISAIRVQCSCGQVIELACVYEPRPEKG